MQLSKKHLNNETLEDEPQQALHSVQTVAVHVPDNDEESDGSQNGDVNISKFEAYTPSTNASDDYAHRGTKLRTMPFYVYRMYVRRTPKPSGVGAISPTIFFYEPHYALANSYAEGLLLNCISVPTTDGFQCPIVEKDAEQNSLLKAMFSLRGCAPTP